MNVLGATGSSRPNAARRAARCEGSSCGIPSSTGRSSWCSPANGRCVSDCAPAVVSTSIPCSRARAATSASSDDLPMPASPRTTIALPFDPARWIRSSTSAISRSRPYRRVAEFPWTTRLQVYVAQPPQKWRSRCCGTRVGPGCRDLFWNYSAKRLTNARAVSATSRQPASMTSECPRLGSSTISVTPGLRFCFW